MKRVLGLVIVSILLWGCSNSDNDPDGVEDTFDRAAMLANWADNIIIPAYQAYVSALGDLKTASDNFIATTDETNLATLRAEWIEAYTAWQYVSMFEIGPAEAVTLRNFTNIYPADVQGIDDNIAQGGYNLTLPSTNDEQGFPALDYLINGLFDADANIVAAFSTDHETYLDDVISRLVELSTGVLNEWTSTYRSSFVNNSGSTATSAVNKMVNDYMFYYEKSLRAGKVGIPAGVFSSSPLNDRVEAFHHGEVSKALLLAALNATQDFFNGKHFGASATGESLNSYLDFLNTIREGEDLAGLINGQFNAARNAINSLSNNLSDQVTSNNSMMLQAYDQLQMNVVLMKVDMFQALNIQVDFVDADGD